MTRNFVKGSGRDRSVWPGFVRDSEPARLNTTEYSCFYCSTNEHSADNCPKSDEEKRRIIQGP